MTDRLSDPIVALLRADPARRRRLTRRAGIEAARRRLTGRFTFVSDGTDVVVRCGGNEVIRWDPWEDSCAHD